MDKNKFSVDLALAIDQLELVYDVHGNYNKVSVLVDATIEKLKIIKSQLEIYL